jgi:hypothetical protein
MTTMKKLFLFLTPILVVAACMKKSTDITHCYLCSIHDSTVSTTPALNNIHYKDTTGNYCHYTQAEELFMIKQKTRVDTMYLRVDSLVEHYVEYWTMSCQQND